MGLLKKVLRRAPGVPRARRVAEFAVTPSLRADLQALSTEIGRRLDHLEDVAHRLELSRDEMADAVGTLKSGHREAADTVRRLDDQQPAVLNAISSTNGVARLLRRELDDVRASVNAATAVISKDEVDQLAQRLAEAELVTGSIASEVRADIAPHVETIRWLLTRVETVRAEMLHELRYGKSNEATLVDAQVINPAVLEPADGEVKINLGCGHLPLDGYANVDMRPLPGVDIVAAADDLPVGPSSIAEIFSAHMLEHFANEEMQRKLLPYWVALLKPGGVFRAVVPDIEAMVAAYASGDIAFEEFRVVAYGGQEYQGDFHFNGFTPASITALLEACGLEQVEVTARGRRNGDCLELEVRAIKPDA